MDIQMSENKKPIKSAKVPVTYGVLEKFRNELKHDIAGVKSDLSGLAASVGARFTQVNAKMDEGFTQINVKLDQTLIETRAMNQRVLALCEAQDSRSTAALDGYASLYEKHHALETRVDKIEKSGF